MSQPSLRWHGSGYVDSNWGVEPLEDGFQWWNWSRADLGRGTAILYDITNRGGSQNSLALISTPTGQIEAFDPPPKIALPPTRWKIRRETRSDVAQSVGVVKALESAPFYARALISTSLLGHQALAVHESLSLGRFRASWVQALLPFRMPRALR